MNKQSLTTLAILGLSLTVIAIFTSYVVYKGKTSISKDTEKLFAGDTDTNTYVDINGNPVSLTQFLGKVVVVTTWASWSPFSESDLNILEALANDYQDDQLAVLAINRKETKEQAQRYLNSIKALTKVRLVIDQSDLFYTTVGGYAMPETIIFDKRGEIKEHIRGTLELETIKNRLEEIFAEQ